MDYKNKSYYPFIDIAKGLCVFCVLMVHTLRWGVDITDNLTTILIKTFYMNVLFVASGYVSAKMWNKTISIRELLCFKTYSLLVPFFVLGLACILLVDYASHGTITQNPFNRLFFEVFNGGYWFLLTLFLCRIITISSKIISQKLKLTLSGSPMSFLVVQVLLCCTWG